jgi:hypothetical protein
MSSRGLFGNLKICNQAAIDIGRALFGDSSCQFDTHRSVGGLGNKERTINDRVRAQYLFAPWEFSDIFTQEGRKRREDRALDMHYEQNYYHPPRYVGMAATTLTPRWRCAIMAAGIAQERAFRRSKDLNIDLTELCVTRRRQREV